MIFVYVLIYMDFISELLFYIQDSVQISAVSHGHSGEVWITDFSTSSELPVDKRLIYTGEWVRSQSFNAESMRVCTTPPAPNMTDMAFKACLSICSLGNKVNLCALRHNG